MDLILMIGALGTLASWIGSWLERKRRSRAKGETIEDRITTLTSSQLRAGEMLDSG